MSYDDIAAQLSHPFEVEPGRLVRDRLGEIRAPTLVVHGTADPMFPLEHGRALARVIPGVTLDGGYAIADQIHNRGQAIVYTGMKETAEHYWEQLRDAGLTMAPLEQG